MGLAFATDGICAARVVRPEGVPPILDVCEFGTLARGDHRTAALERFSRKHRLADAPCSVVIASGTYSLLLVEAPEVPPEELRSAVRWRIQELIDFHIDDALIDVFDVPGQSGSGRPRMMYVVAARLPAVREQTEPVQDADLNLTIVDIPELAQRNVAEQLPEDVSGVALLYLSESSGLITLTRQSTLYLARRLDTGLQGLNGGGEARTFTDRVRAWVDALAVEVQRSLDYYESNFAQPPITSLVVAPMIRAVPGITEHLSEQLGLNVRMLDLNDAIDCASPIDQAMQARCFPAIGAALRTEERTL